MSIERKPFGSTVDGKPAELITVKNASGCTLAVTTYGARIVSLLVPGRDGKFADVVLGHDSAEEYSAYRNFQGALVGRYGNRIANSQFPLDGEIIKLIPSEGVNQLHGGPNGYSMQIWTVDSVSDGDSPSMCLSLTAPDGEGGFPGTLQVKVTYTLTKDNATAAISAILCSRSTRIVILSPISLLSPPESSLLSPEPRSILPRASRSARISMLPPA